MASLKPCGFLKMANVSHCLQALPQVISDGSRGVFWLQWYNLDTWEKLHIYVAENIFKYQFIYPPDLDKQAGFGKSVIYTGK